MYKTKIDRYIIIKGDFNIIPLKLINGTDKINEAIKDLKSVISKLYKQIDLMIYLTLKLTQMKGEIHSQRLKIKRRKKF